MLYLRSYSITQNETGHNVPEIVEAIIERHLKNEAILIYQFESKLFERGFMRDNTNRCCKKFVVDDVTNYIVGDNFPKIGKEMIHPEIIKIEYTINLVHCDRFIVSDDNMLREIV